jgi:hypothetical protein
MPPSHRERTPRSGIVEHPDNGVDGEYNFAVARGWESKSVESQQEDARSGTEPRSRLTQEQREAEARKQGLRLSRSRILEQIRSSANPRYRAGLEQALAAIEEQLARLG